MTTDNAKTQLEKQKDYVQQERIQQMQDYVAQKKGGTGGLFDPELTIKSMRSVRYTSEANAGADLIDNSIESGASQVHVLPNTTNGKITEIAFIDDGSGILSSFLPWAVSWGGSAQHGDTGKRNVFGRFGFGLPTASINRGTAYDVISRTADDFFMVTVDTKDLPRGVDGLPTQPDVRPGKLPVWVVDYLSAADTPFRGGLKAVKTVVVWRNLDRLNSRSLPELESLMLRHYGITYAGWLNQVSIVVNGVAVEPIDVLFTSPAALYFDVEGTRAEDHGSQTIMMKADDGQQYPITVRISRIGLAAYDAKLHSGKKGQPAKIRAKIRREHNGFFMTRHGRFIETWAADGIIWNNYMRQVAVQIDFPPELDEMFGITPDKQTINPRPQVIDVLESKGIFRAMRDLYKQVDVEREKAKAEREGQIDPNNRVSELVMEKATEILTRPIKTHDEVKQREDEARKNLERKVKEKAATTGVSEEAIREELTVETTRKRFLVELVSIGENGVFFNPEQRGLQTVLQINVDHPFFKDVYSKIKPEQFELRSGLELLLFTLALCELDATGQKAAFYLNERIRWGQYLSTQIHVQGDVIADSDLGSFVGENASGDE
jgi:hypothetical protein